MRCDAHKAGGAPGFGVCAFAYVIAHAPKDFYPVNNMGDAAILYCFVFLCFVFADRAPGASTH